MNSRVSGQVCIQYVCALVILYNMSVGLFKADYGCIGRELVCFAGLI